MQSVEFNNLIHPALLVAGSQIWTRIAVQGVKQGLISMAIDCCMRWIATSRQRISFQA
jgi:hypothetical protein